MKKNNTKIIVVQNILIVLAIICIPLQYVFADTSINMDSLYQILEAAPDLKKKESILIKNKPSGNSISLEHVQFYGEWYHDIYEKSEDIVHRINALYYEGYTLLKKGSHTESIEKLKAALIAYEKNTSADYARCVPPYKIKYILSAAYNYTGSGKEIVIQTIKEGLNEALVNKDNLFSARLTAYLGQAYQYYGENELGIIYLIQTDSLYELVSSEHNIINNIVALKVTLGYNFSLQKNIERSKFYFEEVYAMYKDKSIRKSIKGSTKIDLHLYYGVILRDNDEYEKALPLLQEALEIARNYEEKSYLIWGLYELAIFHIKLGDYSKAKPLIIELENYEHINDNPLNKTMSIDIRGVYEKGIGNYNKARVAFLKAKESYESIGNVLQIASTYKELSELEHLANNHSLAYDYLEKYHEIQDSISNEKIVINQEKLQVQYETSKKEKEIILLKNQKLENQARLFRQRNLIGASLFGLLFVGILGFVSFRNSRKTKRINQLLEIKNQQNEILLKEIHHRVKNNLQTISSLLSLQSNSIDDPNVLDAVKESQNRVASMALIHQKLYQGENLAAIEMRDYFKTIGSAIFNSFGEKAKGVELKVDMPEMELDVDTAIPIGLITNELITNSLKYAFQNKENGKIFISLKKNKDNLIQLEIKDNGINQSAGINESGTGFGTMLVKLLTTQLRGQLEQSTVEGTATIIKFSSENKAA